MSHWAEEYIKRFDGPMAVVRACTAPDCNFRLIRSKRAGSGRGTAFREGNKQRGEMIQHIKTAHPDLKPTA
jgi:hypothetical protein